MNQQSNDPSDVLNGATLLRIERLSNNYWVLHFGETVRLNIEAPWRLTSQDAILVARDDDGQKFGLPMAVDAERELRQKIEGHRVTAAVANPATSDLTLQFDNALTLEVLNLSSGYESWTLNDNDGFIWVGRNA
jgi:hypothetical protein